MRVPFAFVVCAALALPTASPAQAPTKPPANDTESSTPKGKPTPNDPCAQGQATVGSGNQVVAPNAKKDQTLSDHLAQSGGVICPPPAVDPAIKAPTPETGNMPVIKPPGSPGGDQSVQPK
jgi:hypothetical protein